MPPGTYEKCRFPGSVKQWCVTYREIVSKVACPTCGAAVGKFCSAGEGRIRPDAHPDREVAASKGTFSSSKKAISGVFSIFKKKA